MTGQALSILRGTLWGARIRPPSLNRASTQPARILWWGRRGRAGAWSAPGRGRRWGGWAAATGAGGCDGVVFCC